jgi:hypothetical protein
MDTTNTTPTHPALFTPVEIHGRGYRLQSVTPLANGAQEWLVARQGNGSMYAVNVAADGTFGPARFLY